MLNNVRNTNCLVEVRHTDQPYRDYDFNATVSDADDPDYA